jgi:hypothetical protein
MGCRIGAMEGVRRRSSILPYNEQDSHGGIFDE